MTNKEFRAIREMAQMTQEELAGYLRIQRRSVARYEDDRKIPGPVEKLMEMLKERYQGRVKS